MINQKEGRQAYEELKQNDEPIEQEIQRRLAKWQKLMFVGTGAWFIGLIVITIGAFSGSGFGKAFTNLAISFKYMIYWIGICLGGMALSTLNVMRIELTHYLKGGEESPFA